MLTRAIVVTVGIALTAVPGTAQTDHEHEHPQSQDSPGMMMHGMMMCPFLQPMAAGSGMMGMMNGGMMGMGNAGMTDHEMMGGMEGMEEGMIGMAGPQRLIALKQDLNLSEAQVAELEVIQEEASQGFDGNMELAMEARARAAEVFSQDPEALDEYNNALRAAAAHMADAHVAMVRSAVEAQGLLTPQQKESVSQASHGMHGMHGAGIMMGEMTGGPGGQDLGQTPGQS